MKITILSVLIFLSTKAFSQSTIELTCHKPLASEKGAEILAEVDYSNVAKKKILDSGPIFIKVWDSKDKSWSINSNIMSGQSTNSNQLLIFIRDLRVHSLVISEAPNTPSILKIISNNVVLEYQTDCSEVPKIPKKKPN